ncbi:MAG: hypothetical protein FJ135_17150 [Deltaproteobacteria bacterium]|nr:hypothetical protein [Deltaproteobacteria bacterium]
MMHTSNFWHFKDAPDDPRLVSIALWAPGWYKGRRRYPALAPRRSMVKLDEASYRVEFQKILDRLDPRKVLEDLGEDAVLLCWEPPGKFCHRRLVAEWLESHLGIEVPEMVVKQEASLFDDL